MIRHRVYLGLGSNLGDREENIRQAVTLIGQRVGEVIRCSTLIETEPWGFASVNRFLNGVILCETTLTPRQVLRQTQWIERALGKNATHATLRNSQQPTASSQHPSPITHHPTYRDRPIDIDILLYDDLTVDEPDLKIPHPLMDERDFVMIPLREITNNN